MNFNPGRWTRSVLLLGVGAAIGAPGGVAVYKKLHAPIRQRPDAGGAPGSSSLAPPEVPPAGDDDPRLKETDLIASKGSSPVASVGLTPQDVAAAPVPGVVAAAVPDVVPAMAPDLTTTAPPDEDPVLGPEAMVPTASAGTEFFGVPVTSVDCVAAPVATAKLLRLRLMKDRCVGGFDGKSSVLDFTGWTRALSGELTYEKGRLAETAKGVVTADAATLETGDADRDKEIREKHLESAKYPTMSFEITSIKMTSLDTMDMTGSMEIHGVKKCVTLPCAFKMRRDGFAWMKGEIKLNMTDFGITPPVKMGVIKVADEFRIWFEIWAEPVKEPKK